ncbi:MAG TPA: BTAD domain-containing putative transcriptional regulator [Actinomycetospora sp.]|nr:BTAD domain-containing putative transcriptional regulator [Actinomycetospora sp.]
MGGRVEIDLLGPFRVKRAGEAVPPTAFGGRQARLLLRVLAVARGTVATRETLIEVLWPAASPSDVHAGLNVLACRVRRALGDPSLIETAGGGYLLHAGEGVSVDAERFAAAVDRAAAARDRGDHRATLQEVEAALDLWRGDPLPEDTFADWAIRHRDALMRRREDALELGARAALALGDHARAADHARTAATLSPLREPPRILLARSLVAGGDRSGALAEIEALRRDLDEELGIGLPPEAQDLRRQLVRSAAGGGSRGARMSAPFTGRDRELGVLARLGEGDSVALVSGPAGSGKSRLLDELGARTERTVLAARAVLPEIETPWSLLRVLLREAAARGGREAQLDPRSARALGALLGEPAERALDPATARALVVEGAGRMLAAPPRPLLLVDDVQWADASSLAALAAALARADDLVAVLAYRPEELAARPEVADFRGALRAMVHPVELRLGRWDVASVRRLVGDPQLASLLAEATDGTPFAVLEVIRELERAGPGPAGDREVRDDTADVFARARAAARAGRRRAIRNRTARLGPSAVRLLALLSLVGRPAPADQLAAMAGGDVGAALAVLGEAELICDGPGGVTTAHDLIRETVRDGLDPAARRGLHRDIAGALDATPGTPGERAHHLAGAGENAAAAAAYVAAARDRLAGFAHDEAGRLAEAGLALDPDDGTRADLLDARAAVRERRGDRDGARDDLRASLLLATTAPERSRLLARLAALALGAEDLARAADLVDLALVEAADEPGARARALALAAIVDMNLGRPARAQERYDEAFTLHARVGDPRGLADVLDARAMAAMLDGEITEATDLFERVARLFSDVGDLLRVVTPRSTRGHALLFADRPEGALTDTADALELARSLDHPEGEAYASWHRSEALTAAGRVDEATVTAERGLALARRIRHRGWIATTSRALGIAYEAAGDLAGAKDAFHSSLEAAAPFPLFTSWAHARLGLLLVVEADPVSAAAHVDAALAVGPPLGHYEARLARCTLAVARREPGALALLDDARQRAVRGGHLTSARRLAELGAAGAGAGRR